MPDLLSSSIGEVVPSALRCLRVECGSYRLVGEMSLILIEKSDDRPPSDRQTAAISGCAAPLWPLRQGCRRLLRDAIDIVRWLARARDAARGYPRRANPPRRPLYRAWRENRRQGYRRPSRDRGTCRNGTRARPPASWRAAHGRDTDHCALSLADHASAAARAMA